jgi:6-pyruvoyl-tetrahydropterin synthase related domain
MCANPTWLIVIGWRRLQHFGWLALLLLLTLPAAWPLAAGWLFKSDDGLLHLFRLRGLDAAIRQGVLYPRIFPEFAFGYGHAVLSYYGPLAYYVAELPYLLGASLVSAFKLAILLGFWGSALAAYALGRRYASPGPALFGALGFVYFPYHLADAYQRGALAEHWAWVFLPLILWAVTPKPIIEEDTGRPWTDAVVRRHSFIFVAAAAALIATHSLTALIFMPFAMVYAWVVSPILPYTRRALSLALPALAVLALSSFYWLPVLFQTRWVQLSATSSTTSYIRHLAPLAKFLQVLPVYDYVNRAGMPDQPLGLVGFLLLLAAVATGLAGVRNRKPGAAPLFLFTVLSLLSLYMTVDISLPLWQAASGILAYLQFPWRFMTLAALGISMASVFVFKRHSKLAILFIPLLIVTSTVGILVVPAPTTASDPASMWLFESRSAHIGSTWDDEYIPWWITLDPRQLLRAALPSIDTFSAPAQANIRLLNSSYTSKRFIVSSENPWVLRMHQFYFPQWRVTLDGKPLATYPSTNLGLLSADVPPTANGIVDVEFASTGAEQLGIALSIFSAVVLLLLARSRRLVAAALLALLASVGWVTIYSQSAPPVRSVQATVGDFAELVAVQSVTGPYRAGDPFQITVTWLALRDTAENLNSFVHLTNAQTGRLLVQSDGIPVGGFSPTSQWHAGEVVEDPRRLTIPAGTPPGTYAIEIGMYRLQPVLENLPISQNGQPPGASLISVGTVQVIP